jgi:hypothetical protein
MDMTIHLGFNNDFTRQGVQTSTKHIHGPLKIGHSRNECVFLKNTHAFTGMCTHSQEHAHTFSGTRAHSCSTNLCGMLTGGLTLSKLIGLGTCAHSENVNTFVMPLPLFRPPTFCSHPTLKYPSNT